MTVGVKTLRTTATFLLISILAIWSHLKHLLFWVSSGRRFWRVWDDKVMGSPFILFSDPSIGRWILLRWLRMGKSNHCLYWSALDCSALSQKDMNFWFVHGDLWFFTSFLYSLHAILSENHVNLGMWVANLFSKRRANGPWYDGDHRSSGRRDRSAQSTLLGTGLTRQISRMI